MDGTPNLYLTDPSGTYHAWKANATGRSAKTVQEFLEKNYSAEAVETQAGAIKLAIKALLEGQSFPSSSSCFFFLIAFFDATAHIDKRSCIPDRRSRVRVALVFYDGF